MTKAPRARFRPDGPRSVAGSSLHWHLIVLALSAIGATVVGAAEPPAPAPGPASQEVAYRIQPGDKLGIKFLYSPEFDVDVIVRPDGRFSIPLAHEVVAEGKTPDELVEALQTIYSTELREPHITVIVESFAGNLVHVGGEVGEPQEIRLDSRISVLEAIFRAGGFTEDARTSDVLLIRRGPDLRPVPVFLDLKAVLKGERQDDNLLLRPFDIIFVPRSKIANANKFVRQYIRGMLPFNTGLSAGFRLDN